MSFCAIIPITSVAAANATLEAQGYGPNNFSVVCYNGATPTHGAFHCWHDTLFVDAVKSIPGVVWEESNGDPFARTNALIVAHGATWTGAAIDLPEEGVVNAGGMYRWGEKVWGVIHTRVPFTAAARNSILHSLGVCATR
jgi:hypothetical protein